jgi:hypothetical protein
MGLAYGVVEWPKPKIESVQLPGGREISVVRDDLMPYGTKQRAAPGLFASGQELVYASPAEGYAQMALAAAARDCAGKLTIFIAARRREHPNTAEARKLGANVQTVRPGYMTVVQARARSYCAETGAELLPFGLNTPPMLWGLAAAGAQAGEALGREPAEVWTVAGSGVLSRSLQAVWPDALFFAVQIGHRLSEFDRGRAIVVEAPEKFAQAARRPPPFPSNSNYDAKAWQFISEHASAGALFWNVAA